MSSHTSDTGASTSAVVTALHREQCNAMGAADMNGLDDLRTACDRYAGVDAGPGQPCDLLAAQSGDAETRLGGHDSDITGLWSRLPGHEEVASLVSGTNLHGQQASCAREGECLASPSGPEVCPVLTDPPSWSAGRLP